MLVLFKQTCSDVADIGFGNQGIDELKALWRERSHARSYCKNFPLKPILRLIRCLLTFTTMPVGSGIENDANAWAVDTMNNSRYPLELFCRVVTVSVETMKIVNSLPALDI